MRAGKVALVVSSHEYLNEVTFNVSRRGIVFGVETHLTTEEIYDIKAVLGTAEKKKGVSVFM